MIFGPIADAVVGLLLVLGAWVAYMATVPSGRVPARPWAHLLAQLGGLVLAASSLAEATPLGGRALAIAAPTAGFAAVMALLFFYLLSQRKTPVGRIRVEVGDRLLPFVATTPRGRPFDSAALGGSRVLLKFFRGHW